MDIDDKTRKRYNDIVFRYGHGLANDIMVATPIDNGFLKEQYGWAMDAKVIELYRKLKDIRESLHG